MNEWLSTEMQSKNWHTREVHAVLEELNTNTASGLSDAEAASRLTKLGSNELIERGN